MWQGHYCGKTPKTVFEYIDLQPLETHSHLTGFIHNSDHSKKLPSNSFFTSSQRTPRIILTGFSSFLRFLQT
ncbi:hypothetical protein DWX43_14615 [Clostridium sp. AF19-22AC]|nr:hypothetical protein DWX43_14615 [Clostridium sp. AF19-22AC]